MLTPFLAAPLLRARVPWPTPALDGPLNPSREELEAAAPASLPAVRLAYALSTMPHDEGQALLRAAARAARDIWIADFVLPERNLCLPSCWGVRLLPGLSPLLPLGPWRATSRAVREFFRNGALFAERWGEWPMRGWIEEFVRDACEYQDNTFQSHPGYYIDYFEMRLRQFGVLHNLHYEIKKIRSMPRQAKIVSDYIVYMAPYVVETNSPEAQIRKLEEMFAEMKEEPLPK